MTHTIIDLLNQCLPLMLGCVAIWKPKGVQIARKYLQNSFENNKDGAGFAYAKGGKITISKGFFDFKEFYEAYKRFQAFPCLIHFRIATHGKINQENCHPFPMAGGKYALVHNGVMPSSLHNGNKDDSDTRQFAEKLETCIGFTPWKHKGFEEFINEAISYNKVAVMRQDGNIWLFNEDKGEWHKGAWYSNHTYAYAPTKWTGSPAAHGATGTNRGYWGNLGYGSAQEPVYSTMHEGVGFYDGNGDWVPMEGDDYSECEELTEEEIASLAEIDPADLEGDMEFMPETEQERLVQRWLAVQAQKSAVKPVKRVPVPANSITDPTGRDWEPGTTGSCSTALNETQAAVDAMTAPLTGDATADATHSFRSALVNYHPHPFVGSKPPLPC